MCLFIGLHKRKKKKKGKTKFEGIIKNKYLYMNKEI